MKTDRVRAIDAARGIAMFFVCLSHFATVYFRESHASTALLVATSVSMVASPTFMIISGLVLGFLYRIHREDFRRIKNKLLDRGLFLLTIGHIFIGLSHFRASAGGVTHAFASSAITDSIGLNLILGPIFIARVGPSRRLLVP